MPTSLNLYETLLRQLEYAEMDANFKNLRTTADGASPMAGPGSAQAFTVGTLNITGLSSTGRINIGRDGFYTIIGAPSYGSVINFGCNSSTVDRNLLFGRIGSDGVLFEELARIIHSTGQMLIGSTAAVTANTKLEVAGGIGFSADNLYNIGSAAYRAAVIYAGTGTINTSDAREKTPVSPLTPAEIAAAKELAKEIGTYQFLAAVTEKGDKARRHVGMTVQRAIEIMATHGLNPLSYGFICYDKWDDVFVDHPAIAAVAAQAAQPGEYETRLVDEQVIVDGVAATIQRSVLTCIKEPIPAVEAVEATPARREQTQKAGDRYSFRPDELLMFIARGVEARLTALEKP